MSPEGGVVNPFLFFIPMIPVDFPQRNRILTAPKKWDEAKYGPCADLPVYNNHDVTATCWRLTLKERFMLLLGFRNLWLIVKAGASQPPVNLQLDNPFTDEKPQF